MASTATANKLIRSTRVGPRVPLSLTPFITPGSLSYNSNGRCFKISSLAGHRNLTSHIPKASQKDDNVSTSAGGEDENGVSLGTMKLPPDIDIPRFESLLFQWANSLCQGANLPLPVPLKVDKVPGGARLGFITIGDGQTQVLVYIDCLVFPPTDGDSGPVFRAVRNGPLKDQSPPGEPRIMRSLLLALKKSADIAKL